MIMKTQEGFVVNTSEVFDDAGKKQVGMLLEVSRDGGPDAATLVLTPREALEMAMALSGQVQWTYQAEATRIVDADTVDFDVDVGFYFHAYIRVRVARIDAWETRGVEREQGLVAKARVEELLPVGTRCKINTSKAGKYGRWIAEVYFDNGGQLDNLSDLLVLEGHAEYRTY